MNKTNQSPTHTEELPVIPSLNICTTNGRFRCPHCNETHEPWYHRLADDKVELRYRCNKVKHFWYVTDFGVTQEKWKYVTATGECEFTPGLPIKEEWSVSYRKKKQKEQELQLPLMR
jgi:hypothetical protein